MKNKIVYIEIIAYYQGWMGHWSVNYTGTQSFEDKISHCLLQTSSIHIQTSSVQTFLLVI